MLEHVAVINERTDGIRVAKVHDDYADYVTILKFIERNWYLPPVTERSRDNFPNPIPAYDNAYAPVNSPAISDLFELFDWSQSNESQ